MSNSPSSPEYLASPQPETTSAELPPETTDLIDALQTKGIDPLLYGSQGASLYLGAFKKFGDVDLLVAERWVGQDWPELVSIMKNMDFALIDEREHEFVNSVGLHVAYASTEVLVRDGIVSSLDNENIRRFDIDGVHIQTLKPELFKRAYEFSARDGYRKDTRGKKDTRIIELFSEYLSKKV